MPSHIANRITVSPKEDIERFFSVQRNEDREEDMRIFDFHKVIPCPDSVRLTRSMNSHVELMARMSLGLINFERTINRSVQMKSAADAVQALELNNALKMLVEGACVNSLDNDQFEIYIQALRNHRETGCLYCYDWNIKNWDTKWNAYSLSEPSPGIIEFHTAWSAPHPVIEKMAEMMLNVGDLLHQWADEDTGNNVGYRVYKDGAIVEERELSDTKEGYELAFLLQDNASYYELIDGKYVHKEDL